MYVLVSLLTLGKIQIREHTQECSHKCQPEKQYFNRYCIDTILYCTRVILTLHHSTDTTEH